MRYSRDGGIGCTAVVLICKRNEHMEEFRYLGLEIKVKGSTEAEMSHRIGESTKLLEDMERAELNGSENRIFEQI